MQAIRANKHMREDDGLHILGSKQNGATNDASMDIICTTFASKRMVEQIVLPQQLQVFCLSPRVAISRLLSTPQIQRTPL